MRTLKNKPLRQTVKINFIKAVPYADRRYYIFLADYTGNIFFYLIFVYHLLIRRIAIVNLQPIQLFIICFRVPEIAELSEVCKIIQLDIHSVRQKSKRIFHFLHDSTAAHFTNSPQ